MYDWNQSSDMLLSMSIYNTCINLVIPVKIDVEQGISFHEINGFAPLGSNMIVDLGVLLSWYNKILNDTLLIIKLLFICIYVEYCQK